jgi:hypothetical protein
VRTSRFPALLCALLLAGGLATAEAPRVIRVPVWVFLEPVPGKGFPAPQGTGGKDAATGDATAGSQAPGGSAISTPTGKPEPTESAGPPAKDLRDLARFVLGGMVYGWRVSYTPSDRARRVDEYFTFEPIAEIPDNDPRFSLSGFDPAYPRVSTWAEFALDDDTARRNLYWKSVQFRSADGRGYGDRERESAGIRDAYSDAVRAAVRAYARKLEKNKPKEIRGEVLLRENPRLFTEAGRFVADITVLVNLIEIVPYTTF